MDDQIVSSQELKKELEQLPKQQGWSSGWKGLDGFINEFREGDLTIISGVTGEGKSSLAVSLTKNFIKLNIISLWFSYELTTTELFERFGQELPVFYLPRLISSKAVQWIEKKIIEARNNYEVKAVFIDHLHYLTDDQAVRNRNLPEILGHLCRQFKLLARKYRLMIFLLAHTRKLRNDQHRPTIEDIKDASGIAQESDFVLIIQRKGKRRNRKNEEEPEELAELSTDCVLFVDKNRRTGRLGRIELDFDPLTMFHKEYEA